MKSTLLHFTQETLLILSHLHNIVTQ